MIIINFSQNQCVITNDGYDQVYLKALDQHRACDVGVDGSGELDAGVAVHEMLELL